MARPEASPVHTSRPGLQEFRDIFHGTIDIRSVSITGIFLLSLLYSLYFARDFLLPVILAFVLSFLLSPAVRWMARLRIPQMLGAGIIIVGLLGVSAYGIYLLSGPAQEWLQKAPPSFKAGRRKFERLLEHVHKVAQKS